MFLKNAHEVNSHHCCLKSGFFRLEKAFVESSEESLTIRTNNKMIGLSIIGI